MATLFRPITELWQRLTLGQRAGLVLALGITAAVAVGAVSYTTRPVMTTLYSGLAQKDAAAIVDGLRDAEIPYEVTSDGSTIKVPRENVNNLRLSFADKGLPTSGEIGYELFDKPMLGMTDFVQKMNFHRALEGEISRTLTELDAVENARVHLVIPSQKLFREDMKPATASIVLHLKSGTTLTPRQVQAIANLTAYSVEGLEQEYVSILDSRGNLLTNSAHNDMAGLSSSQLEVQTAIEAGLESKALTLLEDVLGRDKARVKVTAQLNWDRVERTVESYNQDQIATLSEEVQTSEGGGNGTTERIVTNYNVPHTVERFVPEIGNIEKMWASVLVDGTYDVQENEDGTTTRTYIERTTEELDKFHTLIAAAIGLDPARNDELTVLSFQFSEPRIEEPAPQGGFMDMLPNLLQKLILGGLIIAIFLLAKSLIHRLSGKLPALPDGPAMTATLPAGMAQPRVAATPSLGGSQPQRAIQAPESGMAVVSVPGGEVEVEQQEGGGGPKVVFRKKDQTIVLDEEGPSIETLKHQELLRRATAYINEKPEGASQIMRSWLLDDA